jgi:quercetin dioxygenase-like cupin family protein
MHHLGRLAETPGGAGRYAGHSQGHVRRVVIGQGTGSVHQEVVVSELAPGGRVDRHLHAFEEAFYVLGGKLTLEVAGSTEQLVVHDYVFIDRGVAHALRNAGDEPGRWFEVSAPPPGGDLEDTVFVARDAPTPGVATPYRKAHFDTSELPEPSSTIGLAGFGNANVGGAALKVIVGPESGASQLNLMVVQYARGGFITRHDHAFEEGFFFLDGEIEAELDGEVHGLEAGDYCWSGVRSMHAFANRREQPVRWLETQVPQPPSRYQARFVADWDRFLEGLAGPA